MQTAMLSARIRQPAFTLTPLGVRELNVFARGLAQSLPYLSVIKRQVVEGGKVFLSLLAQKSPPRRELARWVANELDRAAPNFLSECIGKQIADNEEKKRTRKKGDGFKKTAPLAGICIGRDQHPELYTAFFDAVKAGVMAHNQQKLLEEGLEVAGFKAGSGKSDVTQADLIDPFEVVTGQGTGTDLRAEGALLRLSKARMELTRVFDAEEVKSRAEEVADELSMSAHQEKSVLPSDLIDQVAEEEGVILPWDGNPKTVAELAGGIQNPYLYGRVMEALENASEVDDSRRTYLHRDGSPAFQCRKSKAAAPWRPYEPTPDAAPSSDAAIFDALAAAGVEASPFAGEEHQPEALKAKGKKQSLKVVSKATYEALLDRREALRDEADRIADLMGNALDDGDLRESAAYDEARTMMMENQNAMRVLEDEIASVQVGDVADSNIGKSFTLMFGSEQRRVTLTDGQPKIGEVSVESDLGKKLLAAAVGQSLTVQKFKRERQKVTVAEPIRGPVAFRQIQAPKGVRVSKLPVSQTTYMLQEVTFHKEVLAQAEAIQVQVLAIE